MRIVHFLILAAILSAVGSVAQTDYSALNYWKYYSDAENTLYKQQCDIAFDYLDKRKDRIAQLSSADEWNVRRLEVKEMLGSLVGPFPEKTPLNPVITGKVKRDDFTVEKLYFESMPGYKVTAAFYLPKGKKKKLPAIIYCSGHSNLAFRSDTYQHVIINLVKKGFAVFAFDPIGQGERLQYFDEARGASKFGPTHEHSYPGAQLFINGASAARYMIWDGIRCVDYLLTREEVDPERIGITGRSGGGTQTSYIAAFDERIKASAPECYITSLEYLWKSRGPQDAEQNFYRGIVEGYDLADLLEVRAPKPTLMITTTRDIFSIEGSRATFEEARTAYEALGKAENIQMVEDDAGHESTRKNREAMYAFFQEHLNNPGSNRDLNVKIFPVEELYVTETGQISTSIGSKFLFDINRGLARKNCEKLEKSRDKLPAHILNVKRASLELTGYENVKSYGKLIYGGKTAFEDHFLEKYIIECEDGVVLPFIVFNPKNIAAKSVLYLDDIKDKKSDKAHQIPLQLIRRGVRVIVPDMPGYGELGPGYLRGDAYFNNTSFNQWFAGIMNGKSMVAIHAEAMEKVIFHCNELYGASEMSGISTGPFNSSLLHAASFGVDFKEITMINPILSFKSVAENQDYDPACVPFAVAGQLEHYDLPDLVVSIAPKKVGIINAADHQGKIAEKSTVSETYRFTKKAYEQMNAESNFSIVTGEEGAVELLKIHF